MAYVPTWRREGTDDWHAEETVRHVVRRRGGGRTVEAVFESRDEIWLCRAPNGDERRRPVTWAALVARGCSPASTPSALFEAWLAATAGTATARPLAYSDDSGDQIGGMTYRLVGVNDVRLANPVELSDLYREWEPPLDATGEPFAYDEEGFDLLHVLTEAEAHAAGLVPAPDASRTARSRQSHGVDLPAWAASSRPASLAWIDRDTLATSYTRRGTVIPDRLSVTVQGDERPRTWTLRPTRRQLPPDLAAMLVSLETERAAQGAGGGGKHRGGR